jgi:uncharacterized protein
VEIVRDFALGAPPDEAYALLLDLERVTPCLPGARLGGERPDGGRDVSVAVKLGPMRFTYDGSVRIVERDDAARRAVMEGAAREAHGQGNATARIAMTVTPEGPGSAVRAVADLELSGRAAQMGRGVVDDVAGRMIGEMTACLEARLGPPAGAAASAGAPAGEAAPIRGGALFAGVLWARIKALFRRRRTEA